MKHLIFLLFPLFCFSQEVKNYDFYTIEYDSVGTLSCSYRLTKEMVQSQRSMPRRGFLKFNGFVTTDYTNTGYDRSHLLAANFMSFDSEAYKDTYYMGNIVPMKSNINRQIWRYLEEYQERLTLKYGCTYTVIDIIYGDKKIGKLTISIKFIKTISKCNGQEIESFEIENI